MHKNLNADFNYLSFLSIIASLYITNTELPIYVTSTDPINTIFCFSISQWYAKKISWHLKRYFTSTVNTYLAANEVFNFTKPHIWLPFLSPHPSPNSHTTRFWVTLIYFHVTYFWKVHIHIFLLSAPWPPTGFLFTDFIPKFCISFIRDAISPAHLTFIDFIRK